MVLILCKILVLIPRPPPVVDFEKLFDTEGSPSAKFRAKKPHRFTVTLNRTIFQCPHHYWKSLPIQASLAIQ